jgi:hypothetical protein
MDCPYRGSDRCVVPRLLDAVGVRALIDLEVSIHKQTDAALSMMLSVCVMGDRNAGKCLALPGR